MKHFLFTAVAITALAFVGCSKDDDNNSNSLTLNSSAQTMHFGDTYQIDATSETPLSYSSADEYHATVSNMGLVTARCIGTTDIAVTNGETTKKLKITIEPTSMLYPDPDSNLTFGTSKDKIIAKYGTPDEDQPNDDGGTAIAYQRYYNDMGLMCTFDASNKLTNYIVMVPTTYATELAVFLSERYFYVDEEDDMFVFVNGITEASVTMVVGMEVYNSAYCAVMYMPYTGSDTATRSNTAAIKAEMDKLMSQVQW